jgi:hypothetical protein
MRCFASTSPLRALIIAMIRAIDFVYNETLTTISLMSVILAMLDSAQAASKPNPNPSASIQPPAIVAEIYRQAAHQRDGCVQAILDSRATKKIVVAGPGTGKTHLFKRILKGKAKSLTLSFINALIEDLALELCDLSEVKTLHSYAATQLKKKIFPKLSRIIQEDAQLILGKKIDFDGVFHNMTEENEHIPFYKVRKDYYGYYGYADIVYAAVQLFRQRPEKIPCYNQVVVDEFQDFNKLEVCLIDLLAQKSPILVAGDDDQALYEFKGASAGFIRERYIEQGFERFPLPYCSRSTRVIVEAVNDIILAAKNRGYLGRRIDKSYVYFACKEKDQESQDHPSIVYMHAFDTMLPSLIKTQIEECARKERKKFSVLVISPIAKKCRELFHGLKAKGFQTIQQPADKHADPTLMEGFNLLLTNPECNLGWRIVAKYLLEKADFEDCVKGTATQEPQPMSKLIKMRDRKKIRKMLTFLRAVRDGKHDHNGAECEATGGSLVHTHEFRSLLGTLGVDPYAIAMERLKDKISSSHGKALVHASVRKVPIQISTIQGSKGLAADYVFITGFDDRYFIGDKDKSKISDQDICKFLVALTRARRKVYLISSLDVEPTFLGWIKKERREQITVEKKKLGKKRDIAAL